MVKSHIPENNFCQTGRNREDLPLERKTLLLSPGPGTALCQQMSSAHLLFVLAAA